RRAGGVPEAHAVDTERSTRRPAPVRGGGIPRSPQAAQPQLRQGARVGDLGAGPVTALQTLEEPYQRRAFEPGERQKTVAGPRGLARVEPDRRRDGGRSTVVQERRL